MMKIEAHSVILSEAKDLTDTACHIGEMFRCAQHDKVVGFTMTLQRDR